MHTLNLITLLHKIHCCSYLLMIYSHSLARDHHCKSVNKTECGVLTWKNTEQLSIYIYICPTICHGQFGIWTPYIFFTIPLPQIPIACGPSSEKQVVVHSSILLIKNHIVILIITYLAQKKESRIFLGIDEAQMNYESNTYLILLKYLINLIDSKEN